MVMAHVTDAWTRPDDRTGTLYAYTVFVAGLAAPLFLFLAGLTLSMAASARASRVGFAAAAAMARWRGVQIFALAFLFRLQSQLLGWGALINFLKVDILNIMGITMTVAAILWGLSGRRIVRVMLFALATIAVAMSTPLVRETPLLSAMPDAIEAYIRPKPGFTNFALFPWAGFLLAGAIVGELIYAAQDLKTSRPRDLETSGPQDQERRLHAGLFLAGLGGIVIAYAASFQPSIYPVANFWTSSPTFFFIRLGICTVMVPIARGVDVFHTIVRDWRSRPSGARADNAVAPGLVTTTLGRSSLFVYWIHVEMAYGGIAKPIKRALPLEVSLIATVALCALLYAIVKWKDRKMQDVELRGPYRILAPVLK